jgi:CheY-like chemotaxis protein
MGNPLSSRFGPGRYPYASGPRSVPTSSSGTRSGVVPAVGSQSQMAARSGSGTLAVPRRFALVVDDDDASLRTFERLLSKVPGVEILAAQTPSQALGLVAMLEPSPQPIVAFLDVLIPGMDGPRFVHALRTMPSFGGAPIVLVSALSATALDSKALEWGASGVIQKARGLIHVDQEFKGWLDRVGQDTK